MTLPDHATGSCYCGTVKFTATFPTRFVAHCHCENCQRAHGAPMVTWAGVVDAQFRMDQGESDLGHYETETGGTRSFCTRCGTTLFFRSPRWDGEVHVSAVNFDTPLDREPQAHVYADRAAPWCPMSADLPRLGGDDGTQPLDS